MRTPFEESLAAALRARVAGGERAPTPATISLERLTLDYPAGNAEIDHAELADAIAAALDDLMSESR